MYYKATLILLSFFLIHGAGISQERDSISAYEINQYVDSSLVFIADSVKYNRDSLSTIIDSLNTLETAEVPLLFNQPFSSQSNFVSKNDILRNDYRYAGDFFKVFPFSFERSYGFIGQPNDIQLYGVSLISSSYFVDGVPVSNDRIYFFDFNHFQSEDIDSIEIVPLPRGFLYGFATKPVSVNFISRDIIPTKPYSRIKYYEGPFGEAFVDGTFSLRIFNDLIASVDITNRKVDDSYKNSAFSIWQVKSKLRYNLSDNLNLIGSYYFSKSETGINGGIDVDAISQTTSNINSLLYNETKAPVLYEQNSLNYKQHNFGLKILAKPVENASTDLNFYYKFSQEEFNGYYTINSFKSTVKNKILGLLLNQKVSIKPVYLWLQTGYQSLRYTPYFTTSDTVHPSLLYDYSPLDYNSFTFAPLISVPLLDSIVVPSLYFKTAATKIINTVSGAESKTDLHGFGADLSLHIADGFNFYVAYSQFDDSFRGLKMKTMEGKLKYKIENYLVELSGFSKKFESKNFSGTGLIGHAKLWRILLEGKISKYFFEEGDLPEFFNHPKTEFSLGVYFKDTLFNSNLDLKAGFVASYIGQYNLNYLIIPFKGYENDDVPSSLVLSFTVSAEIQKSAIVYFTWENLFDKEYYITPYYPMPERNIRFGVAWEILN